MSELKKVENWTSEETFQHMDNVVRDITPSVYSIFKKIVESKEGYKPTDKEIEAALMLDLFGFVLKE